MRLSSLSNDHYSDMCPTAGDCSVRGIKFTGNWVEFVGQVVTLVLLTVIGLLLLWILATLKEIRDELSLTEEITDAIGETQDQTGLIGAVSRRKQRCNIIPLECCKEVGHDIVVSY